MFGCRREKQNGNTSCRTRSSMRPIYAIVGSSILRGDVCVRASAYIHIQVNNNSIEVSWFLLFCLFSPLLSLLGVLLHDGDTRCDVRLVDSLLDVILIDTRAAMQVSQLEFPLHLTNHAVETEERNADVRTRTGGNVVELLAHCCARLSSLTTCRTYVVVVTIITRHSKDGTYRSIVIM